MTNTATTTIVVGGYVRDVIDDQIGYVASIQDGGYGVIWPGDITPKYIDASEVEATEYPTEDDREPASMLDHNIDIFSSGGGSDGPRRHVPFCLTCNQSLSGVVYDYGEAMDIATDHRLHGPR